LIPIGGHPAPISILEEIEEWKNAQNIETKRNTSEIINNTIPIFKVKDVFFEWAPSKEDSIKIFLLQEKNTNIDKINDTKNIKLDFFLTNSITDNVIKNADMDPIIGQGLGLTKWVIWSFFINDFLKNKGLLI